MRLQFYIWYVDCNVSRVPVTFFLYGKQVSSVCLAIAKPINSLVLQIGCSLMKVGGSSTVSVVIFHGSISMEAHRIAMTSRLFHALLACIILCEVNIRNHLYTYPGRKWLL